MPTANFLFTLEDHRDPSSFSRAVAKQQVNTLPDGSVKPLATSRAKDPTPQSNLTTWSYSDILQGAATLKPVGATYDVFNQTTSNSFVDILGSATDSKNNALGLDQLLTPTEQTFAPYDVILRAKANGTSAGGNTLDGVVASATGTPGTPSATGSNPRTELAPKGVTITVVTVQGIEVNASIADQLDKLLTAAKGAGIPLGGSGWRSHQKQIELRTTNGCPDVWTSPASACRIPTAIPGTSLHESGLAVDFTDGGQKLSRSSRGFNWLGANAAKYGFANLPSEPWHWSINGT